MQSNLKLLITPLSTSFLGQKKEFQRKNYILQFIAANYSNFFKRIGVNIKTETGYIQIEGSKEAEINEIVEKLINTCLQIVSNSNEIDLISDKFVFNRQSSTALMVPVFLDLNFENAYKFQSEIYLNKYIQEIYWDFPDIYKLAIEQFRNSSKIHSVVQEIAEREIFPKDFQFVAELSRIENNIRELQNNLKKTTLRHSMIEDLLTDFKDRNTEVKNYNEEKIREIQEISDKFSNEYGSVKNRLLEETKKEMDEKINDSVKMFKEEADKKLLLAAKELKISIVLQDAKDLWAKKAKLHRKYFYVGSSLFLIVIFTFCIIIIKYWNDINLALLNFETLFAKHPLGGTFLFMIPILAIAWVLRLISRFTMQNLTLADDADQRGVMAETFVKLAGEGHAQDEKDRAIILNALFRPLPGTHQEDIQPPNITDLLKSK